MSTQGPLVMVVSHEATRTGAPKVAVDLLDALRAAGCRTVVVHRWGGPLRADLDAAADRNLDEPASRLRAALRRSRRTRPLADHVERWAARRAIATVRPDQIWCNTVLSAVYVPAATAAGVPVALYSHEQPERVVPTLARSRIGPGDVGAGVTLIGCSLDAATVLADALHRDASTVELLHSPVDANGVVERAASAPTPSLVHPAAVACGTGDHRKGLDVFVAAARRSHAEGSGVSWYWVGKVDDDARADGERDGVVSFVGEVASAVPWIAAADVMVLPSRADAFPLVVLEAMALSRPIVASDIAGPREQLADAGVLVEPGDAAALAAAVDAIAGDVAEASRLGDAARARCLERWDISRFRTRVVELVGIVGRG